MFDWDEVNFAECAREMVVSGNYSQVQLNYQPFWEKPPFFIWLQALSMNLFGINEFAARFPNAICSILTFIAIYLIGKKIHSGRFGIIWSLIYASLLLPHLYFKSGIIDPWFNLFIFLSIYNVFIFTNNPEGKKEILNAVYAGFFLGMAVITKGPAAALIVALTVIIVYILNKNLKGVFSKVFLVFLFSSILFSFSWFIFELLRGNGQVIKEFITYQIRLFETGDAGHDGPFFYHFIVLLVGCFPASFIFISGYSFKSGLTPFQILFRRFSLCLFWVVLILFSIVKTKIIHYSSLCYFPLTYITSLIVVEYFDKIRFNTIIKILYWIVSILFTVAFVLLGFIDLYKDRLINSDIIKDKMAIENLKADVNWSGFEFLIGIVFLIGAILVYYAIKKEKIKYFYYGLIGNLIFIYTAILIVIPKVELYTQHSAIEFYKAISKQKCYVETHKFKSYAYLFYSQRLPEDYTNADQNRHMDHFLSELEAEGESRYEHYANGNALWMKTGKIDRPAYIVVKKNQEDEMAGLGFVKLYEKNGFVFDVRMPKKEDLSAK